MKLAVFSILFLLSCSQSELSTPDPMRTLDEIDLEPWRQACDAGLVQTVGPADPAHGRDVIRWTCTTKDGLDAELHIAVSEKTVEKVLVAGLDVPDDRFEDLAHHLFLPVLRPKYAYLADLPARSTEKPAMERIERVIFEHFKGSPLGSMLKAFRSR
jgi:hypothetical protein